MIYGVIVKPLRTIPDDRGPIRHMLRADWPEFTSFGEVYFSYIEHQAIKAWRKHTRLTMQLAVPAGAVKIVLYDGREDSPTFKTLDTMTLGVEGDSTYALLIVPPGIWNGFQGAADQQSVVVNCASIPHDPNESVALPFDSDLIPFGWT